VTGPNYGPEAVAGAARLLDAAGLPERLMVDASHGNSGRDPLRQRDVVSAVAEQLRSGDSPIRAVMIESHLEAGRQDMERRPLVYGRSITDACLSFAETEALLLAFADSCGP
jgi:3-deoxy-7-phosphoheptulonate synthase